MVGIVSGNSLGLDLTSGATLGQRGQLGQSALGQTAERSYVNVATGNLVVQDVDDFLASNGLDVTALRTYNSQGLMDDDNADNWSNGFYRKQLQFTGAAGSTGTVTRTGQDGSQAIYTYDAARSTQTGKPTYVTTAGAGAYDTISYSANQFTWTDGDSGISETYTVNGANDARLTSATDHRGGATSYEYKANGLISKVTGGSGEAILYDYDDATKRLLSVRYVATSGAQTAQVSFTHDGAGRLSTSAVDLTPENLADNATTPSTIYTTTYTYEGTSKRLASITQGDKTAIKFTHTLNNGVYRVTRVEDGLGKITNYTYTANLTTVRDALGNTTTYNYDAVGQLVMVEDPTQERSFMLYDAAGRKVADIDATGTLTEYTYNKNNLVTRSYTYGATALAESLFVTSGVPKSPMPTLDSLRALVQADPATDLQSWRIYDANGHLIKVADATLPANNREFVNDVTGKVLYAKQGSHIQRQLIVNGEVLGRYGEMVDDKAARNLDGSPVFKTSADFNFAYEATAGNTPDLAQRVHVVGAGDTLETIAKAMYGDTRLWYRIADANGMTSNADLKAGQLLKIPGTETSANNADTFRPYRPGEIIGDTNPNMPRPPPKKTDWLAQLLVVIVVVIVAAMTQQYQLVQQGVATVTAVGEVSAATLSSTTLASVGAAVPGASMTAGAIAGAAGSVAGQIAGNLLGTQQGFDFKQLALSALSGGISGGLSGVDLTGSGYAGSIGNRVAQAALGNSITQGIGVVTGTQEKFNWQGVLGSAAGAGVGQAVAPAFSNAFGHSPAGQFGARLATGLVAGATAAVMRGGKIAVQQVAVDAFGNALGSSLVDPTGTPGPQSKANEDVSAFVDAVRGYSQAGGGIVYPSELVADSGSEDHIARLLRLSKEPASDVSFSGPASVNRVLVTGTSTDGFAGMSGTMVTSFNTGSNLASMYPDSYVVASGTNQGLAYEDWSTGARATEVRSSDVIATELEPLSAASKGLRQDNGSSLFGLAGRFGRGALHGVFDMAYQPVAQTVDLGQAAVGLVSGGAYEPRWFSGIGQNYAAGMSREETIFRAVAGSIPVTGIGLSSYDLTSSALQGDWGGVAEGLGGMVGSYGVVKGGQRHFAPEPGAQLGIYRTRPTVDVPAQMVDSMTLLAPLPGEHARNFTSATPVNLTGRNLNRIFDNISAYDNGAYWTEKTYSTESAWRSGVAVPKGREWNSGTFEGHWQPERGWGWGGKAAPQAVPNHSVEKWGFTAGWIQRGGDYQVWIPDSRKTIPAGAVTSGPTPWRKP